MQELEIEALAKKLETHEDYRVLRRIRPRELYNTPNPGEETYRGIFLDVETTGLDTASAGITELAIVPFEYSKDGLLLKVHQSDVLEQFNDPGMPIPEDVTKLTGITNEMVSGKKIDDQKVATLIAAASLVISHNASFDRPIVERFWPQFSGKNWACSIRDIPWLDEGVSGTKLEFIATALGMFYEPHRALDDCMAGIEVLSSRLPASKNSAMSLLLDNARAHGVRISAVGSPFETKDLLKARGYRWNSGKKVWWTEVPEKEGPSEFSWLGEMIYPGRDLSKSPLPWEVVTAKDRYRG